jgi:hypothetical protein
MRAQGKPSGQINTQGRIAMLNRTLVLASASALSILAFVITTPTESTAAPKGQSATGRITGVAVDPPDPARGARLKAGPKAGSAARYHHGFVNRFSQGRR